MENGNGASLPHYPGLNGAALVRTALNEETFTKALETLALIEYGGHGRQHLEHYWKNCCQQKK